jgi:chromosome segregation ATPase
MNEEGWRKEIEKLLNNKIASAIKEVEAQRDRGFAELAELGAQMDAFEAEKRSLHEERGKLNPLKNADMKALGLMDMRVSKIEKQLRSLRKKVDAIVLQLTELPADDSLLWLTSKKGVSHDKL